MDEQSLGRHLQAARQASGLTQQELCQRAGISYSTLAKIERGAIKAPSVFTIQRLAEVLGTTLDALMGSISLANAKPKGRSKSGVTFVYFDINGCLVHFFNRAFSELAKESGVGADVIEAIFWQHNDAVCRGDMPMDEFNRIMAETCHMMVDLKQYYLRVVEPITEMHQLVGWAAEHYKIGLLSNILPSFIPDMQALGLLPDVAYDAVVDSSEVRALKPEPQMFEIAAQKAGVPVQEILLVDDARENVKAAGQQGWKVLWFDDYRTQESVDKVRQALELETGEPPKPVESGFVVPAPHEIAL